MNSEKEHQVLFPLSALAGFTQFIIPLRMQRDSGTHPSFSSCQLLGLARGREQASREQVGEAGSGPGLGAVEPLLDKPLVKQEPKGMKVHQKPGWSD